MLDEALLSRSELLLGEEGLKRLQEMRIILFGVGGVGSWCAEALVRTGVRHLTIVDADKVCASNVNRQLMATTLTIGEKKVDVMKQRLLEIAPEAEIEAIDALFSAETADSFHLENYDVIIDAIDSLRDKAELILRATALPVKFVSSMGAALRMDPTKVRVSEFWKVEGDALARALRNKFKKAKTFPGRKFQCVWSEETPLPNVGKGVVGDDAGMMFQKAQTNGSLCHITAIFGMTLAGLVIPPRLL